MSRRERDRRYKQSAVGKATQARYEATERAKARQRRYELKHPERRHTRLFIGKTYAGRVETPALAAAINAHIKERMRDFKGQQARAQVESVAAGPVRLHAAMPAD